MTRRSASSGRGDGFLTFEDVTVLHETEPGMLRMGAIRCDVDGALVWIPKSAIHDDSEVYKMGTSGQLIIPERLAREKGIA